MVLYIAIGYFQQCDKRDVCGDISVDCITLASAYMYVKAKVTVTEPESEGNDLILRNAHTLEKQ